MLSEWCGDLGRLHDGELYEIRFMMSICQFCVRCQCEKQSTAVSADGRMFTQLSGGSHRTTGLVQGWLRSQR